MLVVEALRPEAGMRILDCCAAPGGKTTHIAERMGNMGEVIANDIHTHKIKLIDEQAKRLGLTCVYTTKTDAVTFGSILPLHSFDAVLLDAPCTGLGVIRRKPDIKWRQHPEDVTSVAALQTKLIAEADNLSAQAGVLYILRAALIMQRMNISCVSFCSMRTTAGSWMTLGKQLSLRSCLLRP